MDKRPNLPRFPQEEIDYLNNKIDIAKGNLPYDLGNSNRDSGSKRGDGEGEGRQVQVGGDVGVPMADREPHNSIKQISLI